MKNTDELEHNILENPKIINNIPPNIISAKELLNQLLIKQDISISALRRKLGASSYIYEIFDIQNEKNHSRINILTLLIALNADLETANRILQLFSFSKIYVKNKQDAVIYYAINNQLTLEQTNDLLIKEGFDILSLQNTR